jgi:hypothetical protein
LTGERSNAGMLDGNPKQVDIGRIERRAWRGSSARRREVECGCRGPPCATRGSYSDRPILLVGKGPDRKVGFFRFCRSSRDPGGNCRGRRAIRSLMAVVCERSAPGGLTSPEDGSRPTAGHETRVKPQSWHEFSISRIQKTWRDLSRLPVMSSGRGWTSWNLERPR